MSLTPHADAWRASEDAWWAGFQASRTSEGIASQASALIEKLKAIQANGVTLSEKEAAILEAGEGAYAEKLTRRVAREGRAIQKFQKMGQTWVKQHRGSGKKTYTKQAINVQATIDMGSIAKILDRAGSAQIATLDELEAETATAAAAAAPVRSGYYRRSLLTTWYDAGKGPGARFDAFAPYTFVAASTARNWALARRSQAAGMEKAGSLLAKNFEANHGR